MTEAHAFRDDLPPAQRGDESPWPAAVEAADPADGGANAVALPPPVPAPAGPPGLVAEDGARLVAGLAWEIASGPEAPVLRKGAPQVLRLPTRRARLADAGSDPCGSLLLHMAADLVAVHFPAASGAWAFIAELPEPDGPPSLWMALADISMPTGEDDGQEAGEEVANRVTPRPGPEVVFDDVDDAIGALEELLRITDIAGIAVRWLPFRREMTPADTHRGTMISAITACAARVEFHDVGPDVPLPQGFDPDTAAAALPVFAPPRRLPVRLLGATGVVGGAFLAGAFVILPMVQEALRPKPPPLPEMVRVEVLPGAFADACTGALDAWWPRVTGWRVGKAGCAVGGYLPDEPVLPEPVASGGPGVPLVIWRDLVPETGRNKVLAHAAAAQVIASWGHEARIEEQGVTLWKTATLPMTRPEAAGDGAAAPAQDADAVRARLAALWADAPDAVTDLGGGVFTIGTRGAAAEAVLARAARVPGIAPVRLVKSAGGSGELVLAPVMSRAVPAALLDANQGGPAQ